MNHKFKNLWNDSSKSSNNKIQVYQHSGVDGRSLFWKFIKIKTATQAFSGDLYRILNGRNTPQDYLRFIKDF